MNVTRHKELRTLDLREQVFFGSSTERKYRGQHVHTENTKCPNISFQAVVAFLLNNFRCHVVGCAAKHAQPFFRLELDTEPEIDYL